MIDSRDPVPLWRGWGPDAAVALVFLLVASLLGAAYAGGARKASGGPVMPRLNQRIVGAAVMQVCGYGRLTPVVPMAAEPTTPAEQYPLIEFLAAQRESLTCAEVPAALRVDPLDAMQVRSQYLLALIAGVWSASGMSWPAMDWLLGIMFGLSVALAYLTCRHAMPPVVAATIALLAMLSASHLSNIPDLRDYSKVPFFFATLWLVGFLVSRIHSLARVLGVAAAAGVIVALGFGMRTDTGLNLGVVIAAIAGFLPAPLRSSWRLRCAAVAVCVFSFALVALPILRADQSAPAGSGSLVWHWALLGLGRNFDRELDVTPGPYELADSYSDSYASAVVDGFSGRALGSSGQAMYGTKLYEDAAKTYYFELVRTFPADALLRGWAALIKIVELPYADGPLAQRGVLPPLVETIVDWRGRALVALTVLAVPLLFVVLATLCVDRVRVAILVSLLVLFFGSYPSIQFQARHVFHLEFVSLWILGIAITGLLAGIDVVRHWERSRLREVRRRVIVRPALFLMVTGAMVAVPLAGLRAYQQSTATALFATYEAAGVQVITPADEAISDGTVRLARGDNLFQRPRGGRSIFSEMLVVDLSGQPCGLDQVALTVRYASSEVVAEFSRTVTIDLPADGRRLRWFIPVYETGATNRDPQRLTFDALEVNRVDRPCVMALGRFARPDDFRVLLNVRLAEGWRGDPLHQVVTLGGAPPARRVASYWEPSMLRGQVHRLLGAPVTPIPVGSQDLAYLAPNADVDEGVLLSVDGRAEAPGSYLVAWKARSLAARTVVAAEGLVDVGGVSIGLTKDAHWIAKVDVDVPGPFRVFLEVPAEGAYQVVVANHLVRRSLKNRATISRLGFVEVRHE